MFSGSETSEEALIPSSIVTNKLSSSNLSIKFRSRLDKIIQSNPDYLKVSLSGFYPEAYNNTHQGGDID